ncbi:MAG: tRNA (cytidine(34)-2'-O)-methyltransferase [Verrucomicrobiota bacterium]
MNIVLVEPEIPQNTGNIARLCALTSTHLHLVGPLGFSLSEKHLKRAGMDYWEHVEYTTWKSWDEWISQYQDRRLFFFTTKTNQSFLQAQFQPDDFLVFGRESRGLSEAILRQFPENLVTIPMPGQSGRSLNLATSVGIGLYEAMRQADVIR